MRRSPVPLIFESPDYAGSLLDGEDSLDIDDDWSKNHPHGVEKEQLAHQKVPADKGKTCLLYTSYERIRHAAKMDSPRR